MNFGLKLDKYIDWSWKVVLWPTLAMCVISLIASTSAIYYFIKMMLKMMHLENLEKKKKEEDLQKKMEEEKIKSPQSVDMSYPDDDSDERD